MKIAKHIFYLNFAFWLGVAAPGVWAGNWTVMKSESSIAFTGMQTGVSFSGTFDRFAADISYDPAAPTGAYVRARIDLASASTGDLQRDTALPEQDWFFVTSFPRAIFEAKGFKLLGENRYSTTGTLTLRGVKKSFALPFDLEIDGNRATMDSTFTLNRADHGVGSGPWAEGKWVGLDVVVTLHIVAERNVQ